MRDQINIIFFVKYLKIISLFVSDEIRLKYFKCIIFKNDDDIIDFLL